jgi:hypothetical protein
MAFLAARSGATNGCVAETAFFDLKNTEMIASIVSSIG